MSNLNPYEQYLLELINRARANPNAEAARLGIGLNDDLAPGTISGAAKQPLAGNNLLNRAATDHSLWMLATDTFSHTGAGGSRPWDRMDEVGYQWRTAGENISYRGVSGNSSNSAALIESHHNGLFRSEGHRTNLMNDRFDEVGLSQEFGLFTGFNVSMLTEKFGSDGGDPYVLGVVFDDRDGDDFFDPGEELPGVQVTITGQGTTTTGPGGGYELRIDAGATVQVTFSGGGISSPQTQTISVGSKNVKIDLNLDDVSAPPAPIPEGVLEVGSVTVAQARHISWYSVEFSQTIEDAVVVMGPISLNGGDEAVPRVRNVTDTGFEFQLDEWDGLDGGHIAEDISWIALSAGSYTLADGRTISAGETLRANEQGGRVALSDFDDAPVVLAQVSTGNGGQAVTDRIYHIDANGFSVAMQEAEAAEGKHVEETVSWIAVEAGGTGSLQAGVTLGVDHSPDSFQFADGLGDTPELIADLQTFRGGDTSNLRALRVDGDGARIILDEERSYDAEVAHVPEDVGWLAADAGTYDLFA